MVVSLLALSLTAVMALPAVANHGPATGEGAALSGEEVLTHEPPSTPPPFCLEVTASTYEFFVVDGEFEGHDSNGDLVIYEGPATVEFTTTETYYIAPEGTYGERDVNDECDTGTFGALDPVEGTAEVTGADNGGSISCENLDGTYYREGDALVFEFEGACDIDGNVTGFTGTGTTSANTEHDFDGVIVPCLPGDPNCTDPLLSGLYTYAD